MSRITEVKFKEGQSYIWGIKGLIQWNQGQHLEISGLDISDEIVEVHFSLDEVQGNAKRMVGVVKGGVIHADIPAFILEGPEHIFCNNDTYNAYAWIYLSDEESAETVRKIEFTIEARPKPDEYVTPEELTFLQQLELAIQNKLDKSGHTPNKFLGTDEQGNVVTKDVEEFNLEVANEEKLGGVKPLNKTDDMTLEVGVDKDGRLFAKGKDITVDSELDEGSKNPVQNKVLTKEVITLKERNTELKETIEKLQIKQTTDKAPFHHITDSAKAKPKNIRLYGKTEQPQYKGNQLFDVNLIKYYTSSGITASIDGTILTLNGTNTSTAYIEFDLPKVIPMGTQVSFTLDNVTANSNVAIRLQSSGVSDGNTYFALDKTNKKITVTTSKNCDSLMILVNPTTINMSFSIMLSENADAELEPYTGNEPSPSMNYQQPTNHLGESGSIVGKVLSGNVFNYKEVVNNFRNKNYVQLTSGYYVTSLQFKPNTEYYLKVNGTRSTWSTFLISTLENVNSNYNKAVGISNTWDSEKCVTTDETGLIYFGIENPVDNQLDRIEQSLREALVQIEIGSSATPYKPHTEQPFTVLTPNGLKGIGDVRDYVDLESGTRIQNLEKHTITEDGTFIESSDYISFEIPHKPNSKFLFTHGIQDANIINWANNTYMFVMKSFLGVTTIDEFKNLIREKRELGESMEIIYALAEPIITDLTQEELDQYNSLVMNYPNTTIINNENAYMEVEYVADTKCYIDNKFKQLEMALANTNANLL